MTRHVVSLALVLLTGCGYVAKEALLRNPRVESILDRRFPFDRTLTQTGSVTTVGSGENTITVLHVTGTPYEMGYQHGQLLKTQIRATIRDVEAGELQLLPKVLRHSTWLSGHQKQDIINHLLDRAWEQLRPHTPRADLEEMAGLAAGSGISLHVIHRMHAIPDLGETSCSGMVAFGDATRDRHVWQLRILDYGANFSLHQRPLITVYHPLDSQPYINIGWIGFVGVISGMNRSGVALSEMGFGKPPGETLRGIPMPFLLKNVLRYATNAGEGAGIIRAAPRTNSYIYFIGDRHGHALGLITSAQRCDIHPANSTNELTVGKHLLPQYKDIVYAGHSNQKQASLTGQLAGQFDLTTIQDLARQIAMKSNLHTVIYDLTADKFWVANRHDTTRAADRPYIEFDAGAAWRR